MMWAYSLFWYAAQVFRLVWPPVAVVAGILLLWLIAFLLIFGRMPVFTD
jgi:hypothetical protein